jgi:hypothetical protein
MPNLDLFIDFNTNIDGVAWLGGIWQADSRRDPFRAGVMTFSLFFLNSPTP